MARRKGSVGAVRHDDSVLFSSSLPLLVAGIAIGICGGAVVDYFGDHEPSGSVRMLFATPLYVDNVAGVLDIAALNALALDGYTRVTQDATVKSQIRNAKLKEAQQMYPGESFNIPEDEDDSEANNMLFYYQMKTGRNGIGLWKELRDAYTADNGSIRAMMNYIEKKAVPRYFASIGVPKSALPTRLKVNLWAGVLRDGGAEHGAHTHQQDQECLLSGVLYTQVPAGSGPLVFSDPRSATEPEMPDFLPGKDFAFHPKAGDIAMFPPWQVHQVKPSSFVDGTEGDEQLRIAWAFNVMGMASEHREHQTKRASVGTGTGSGQGAITRDIFEVVVGVEQHARNNG